uniref:Growth arrest-specific protein 8 domain-containing protein n=1 Tax=Alexandrium monilatum TaxID=311494 RepID=A0A7S4T9I1_9DINO
MRSRSGEERKNQHINELMMNHQEAFDEIKAYYNDITFDNLNLIKSLRDDIQEMKERERKNQRKMTSLTQENKELSEPLAQRLEEQRELEEKLKSYTKELPVEAEQLACDVCILIGSSGKLRDEPPLWLAAWPPWCSLADGRLSPERGAPAARVTGRRVWAENKMALKNLKAHHKQLQERTVEAQEEYRATEEKYRKLEKERDDLYRRFQKAVRETQRRAELGKNAVLERKLEVLTAQFDEKQAQLTEVLTAARLDPTVVASVTKKLEQVLGAKSRQIKDLQYQVLQCTKAYNDTIRVYESKLPSLGIDPEEIGFEPIQTATSYMPARLVTKVP